MPIPTRMSPLVRSIEYAPRRAATLETSRTGEFDPSTVRKIGSVPPVASKRACTPAGVIPQFAAGSWHVAHTRPFVPFDTKNGFVRLNGQIVVYVVVCPVA